MTTEDKPRPYLGLSQLSGHSRTPVLVVCNTRYCKVCAGRVKQREQRYGKEGRNGE